MLSKLGSFELIVIRMVHVPWIINLLNVSMQQPFKYDYILVLAYLNHNNLFIVAKNIPYYLLYCVIFNAVVLCIRYISPMLKMPSIYSESFVFANSFDTITTFCEISLYLFLQVYEYK